MNKLSKVLSVLVRSVVKKLDYVNRDLYMGAYNSYLSKIGIKLNGTPRYIHPSVYFDGKGYDKISIGDRVVISFGSSLLCHDYSIACALRAKGADLSKEAFFLKEIEIGDNVFIGCNVTILPGTKIGDNTIIGAGSVVKGIIPAESIVYGNPAVAAGSIIEWAKGHERIQDYNFEYFS